MALTLHSALLTKVLRGRLKEEKQLPHELAEITARLRMKL